MTRDCPRLFVVTTDRVARQPGFDERLEAVVAVGGRRCAVQLRAHGRQGGEVYRLASELRRRTRRRGTQLWINDRVDVAMTVGADGVQLGRRSVDAGAARRLLGRSCWIGRSVHAVDEVEATGADVYVLGNVYETASHPGRPPLGLTVVRAAAELGRPIVAIGGITPERTCEVVAAGAWGVAVLGGVWEAADAGAAMERYVGALEVAVSDDAMIG